MQPTPEKDIIFTVVDQTKKIHLMCLRASSKSSDALLGQAEGSRGCMIVSCESTKLPADASGRNDSTAMHVSSKSWYGGP